MKKILFTLLALVGTMSMNAQVMKIMKNGEDTPIQTYKGSDYYVVFEEAPAVTTTGTAKATINGVETDVNWVQLWKGGPKFAEYNVGAASATDYGGYYTWGGKYKNGADITWNDDHNTGSDALTGDSDTATKLWGSNWCMPTKAELQALLDNCDVTCTDNYNSTGKKGRIYTGRGDYSSNSVFLPAAGYCDYSGVHGLGYGRYWSSTPNGSITSYHLYFNSGSPAVGYNDRFHGFSVRAVLAE